MGSAPVPLRRRPGGERRPLRAAHPMWSGVWDAGNLLLVAGLAWLWMALFSVRLAAGSTIGFRSIAVWTALACALLGGTLRVLVALRLAPRWGRDRPATHRPR